MHRIFIIGALIGVTLSSARAQNFQRSYRSIFPEYGNYQRQGWILSPSLNYTLPPLKNDHERLWTPENEPYNVEYDAAGKVGVGVEVGRFHVVEQSRLISHLSLTMGVKILRGVERFEAVLDDPDRIEPFIRSGGGVFNHTYATMSFEASNIQQFSANTFLENSLGINGDYRVFGDVQYNKSGMPMELTDPSRFIFQAHYRIGYGFKLATNILVIPSLETPILTFYEYNDLKSTLPVFHSRYRPIIFRVNVLLMDKKADRKCPSKNYNRRKSENLFSMSGTHPW